MTKIISDDKIKKKLILIFRIIFGTIILIGILFLIFSLYLVIFSSLPREIKLIFIPILILGFFLIYGLPIIISVYLIIVPLYNFLFKGIKLETTASGVNIGKRYAGPHDLSFNKNIYYYPIKKDDKILNWDNLKNIYFKKRQDLTKIKKIYTVFLPLAILAGSLPSVLMLSSLKSTLSECGYIFFETKDKKKYIIDGNFKMWNSLNTASKESNRLNIVSS